MTQKPRQLAAILLLWLVLAGCASPTPELPPSASPTLQVYRSPTATEVLDLSATRLPAIAGASPTPFVHEVVEGDTLLGIALRYGVELDQLLAANPEIDPRFLSVGQAIHIPGPDGTAPETILPTSTPVGVPLQPPACYLSVSGGSVCFALAENPGEVTIEGLTAQVSLLSPQGSPFASQLAYPPLNLLPAGVRMPLVAHFPRVESLPSDAQAILLSAVEAPDLTGRYLPVELGDVRIDIQSGLASVQFQVANPASNDLSAKVIVVAVAYDAGEQVVGYRKWEAPEPALPGESLAGEFEVATLGPAIDQVEVWAEAQPALPGDE